MAARLNPLRIYLSQLPGQILSKNLSQLSSTKPSGDLSQQHKCSAEISPEAALRIFPNRSSNFPSKQVFGFSLASFRIFLLSKSPDFP
ncbi:hypothetical protein Nepgr_028902 [Nepenthes gracilis]|uniref:Uncharacterized protein n=1 Tax=Nepenthes gracilis TaxID=150966 RepID=A0AAD3Y4I0_NEPGR|nr:hypothetical protein Nepgr_028902 [Nepenthes gracilis]